MNKPGRMLSAAAGYAIDLCRLAQAEPRNPHSYMKYLALRGLARRTGARCLIETGTFRGVTSARCARIFARVVTIELDAALARDAEQRLARHANVTVLQGDAAVLLPAAFERHGCGDAVVFLDGHFSGGITAKGPVVEPALAELEILARYADRICGIVIDDFRLFGVEPGFPKKAELTNAAESLFPFPAFALGIHFDQMVIERLPPGIA